MERKTFLKTVCHLPILFGLTFFLNSPALFAQEEKEQFAIVETLPEYPGGEAALLKYVQKEIEYPEFSKDYFSSGKVVISYVIDTSGAVIDPEILNGIDSVADAEVVDAFLRMPKWTPGRQKGKLVKVAYTMPFNFKQRKAYKAKKLGLEVWEGLEFSCPLKWEKKVVKDQLLISPNGFGVGDNLYLSVLKEGEDIHQKAASFDQQFFSFESVAHRTAVNGYPAKVLNGWANLSQVMEYITSPYKLKLITVEVCDKEYAFLLMYFEEDKLKSRSRLSAVLETISCAN